MGPKMNFSISLKRLASIVNNEHYEDMALKIFKSCDVFKDDELPVYYSYLDLESGRKRHIDPKYNFLMLKGIIIFNFPSF